MEYERALYRIYERAMEELPSSDLPPEESISFLPPLLTFELWLRIFVACRNQITRTLIQNHNLEISPLSSIPISSSQNNLQLHEESQVVNRTVHEGDETSTAIIENNEEEEYSDHDTPRPSARHRHRQLRQRRRRHSPITYNSSLNQMRTLQNTWQIPKLQLLMQVMFWLALFHLVLLTFVHRIFISNVRNKVVSVRKAFINRNITRSTTYASSTSSCIEYALATRPLEERINRYFSLFGDYDYINATQNTKQPADDNNATSPIEPPLLFHDEILQIRLIPDSACTTLESCSRVHTVQYPSNTTFENTTRETNETFWEQAMYQYSSDRVLLSLNDRMKYSHNITMVNVTLSYTCLFHGKDLDIEYPYHGRLTHFVMQIYNGMEDTVILNQLMYGIRSTQDNFRDGALKNLVSKQSWVWQSSMLNDFERVKSNIFLGLVDKLGIIITSLLAFFLITSINAFLVRVLTTSGVVVMFPIFALFRAVGLQDADERLLLYSYPWIGRQRQAATRDGMYANSTPLVAAHLAKLFLCYVLYEASEAEWGLMFYDKGSYFGDETTSLWIFGFFTLVEYFSLIFLRSVMSVRFFSRIMLLYFLWYHFYFYSVPYSFFGLALIPWFCLIVHSMLFTMLAIEQAALSRGAISLDCPREVFTKLSWSEFSASLPHEFTLFLPLNARYIPVHDMQAERNPPSQPNSQASHSTETDRERDS